MFKKITLFFIIFSLYFPTIRAEIQLASVREQVENRWQAFQNNKQFTPFTVGKLDACLKEEFENIKCTRKQVWLSAGYETAQHLITQDLIRAPGCVAFNYNNTVSDYNASTMCLGKRHMIACEGPRSKDVPRFFNLIKSHHVTHLVRLTDAYDGETKKCHPYWEGLSNTAEGKAYLSVPAETGVYSVRAFDMAFWKDNQGVDPDDLLACVLKVKNELSDSGGLLLVHCSAGVGRTGTFLAALAIVDAIDQKEAFSIEEIVYRLSLQRVHSVAQESQYITLHRLAENYLKQKI